VNQHPLVAVTVTGADDTINPEEFGKLVDIWRRFPFVEFGLLMAANNTPMGRPRFPSLHWLQALARYLTVNHLRDLRFSAHLCGKWVQQLLMGEAMEGFGAVDDTNILDYVDRYQLNTHGVPHMLRKKEFLEAVDRLPLSSAQIIFQLDGANNELPLACKEDLDVAVLHDVSSGAGRLPVGWNSLIPGLFNGYAGGLSPKNVVEQLRKIGELLPERKTIWIDTEAHLRAIWIDAETHLRSIVDGRDIFDLDKVTAFLEAVQPYVAPENRGLG
jgi:hypothetical protein